MEIDLDPKVFCNHCRRLYRHHKHHLCHDYFASIGKNPKSSCEGCLRWIPKHDPVPKIK